MIEWERGKMSYSFENKKIDEHIQTYTVYQVDKMPDLFLEVEFSYPRSQPWKTCIPIYEKYQGINLTNAPEEGVEEGIQECYESMSPSNASVWNRTEKVYWEKHLKEDNLENIEELWIKKYENIIINTDYKKVLDLGCGIGQYTNYFIEKEYDVVATDISKKALDYLSSKNSKSKNSFARYD